MAKHKSSSNVAVLEEPQVAVAQDIGETDDDLGGSSEPIALSTAMIEVPVAPFDPSAHRSRLVTVRLSQRQADALKCVHLGLTSQHARLATGGHVDKQAQVIQWMLEALADAIERSSRC